MDGSLIKDRDRGSECHGNILARTGAPLGAAGAEEGQCGRRGGKFAEQLAQYQYVLESYTTMYYVLE